MINRNMRLDTQGGDVERRFVELGLAVEARAMPVVCPKTTKRHGIDQFMYRVQEFIPRITPIHVCWVQGSEFFQCLRRPTRRDFLFTTERCRQT
jgi:hypothetical protein